MLSVAIFFLIKAISNLSFFCSSLIINTLAKIFSKTKYLLFPKNILLNIHYFKLATCWTKNEQNKNRGKMKNLFIRVQLARKLIVCNSKGSIVRYAVTSHCNKDLAAGPKFVQSLRSIGALRLKHRDLLAENNGTPRILFLDSICIEDAWYRREWVGRSCNPFPNPIELRQPRPFRSAYHLNSHIELWLLRRPVLTIFPTLWSSRKLDPREMRVFFVRSHWGSFNIQTIKTRYGKWNAFFIGMRH